MLEHHPPPVRTASGNGEERTAQMEHIIERHLTHQGLRDELAALARERDRLETTPVGFAEHDAYRRRLEAFHRNLDAHLKRPRNTEF